MSTLANRINQLSPAKLALLSQRLKEKSSVAAEVQSIPRRNTTAPAPVSYAQQRLWFLDQLEPGNVIYNLPEATRLRGRLDVSVLAATLTEVVGRHEILRTTFDTVDGRPVQIVAPAEPLPLPFVDLSALPDPEKEARRLIYAEGIRPFDLTRGPLLRATLIKLDEEDHVVLLNMHHIISDGWSVSVLTREVAALYSAFSNDQPSPLAELPIQYADYSAWQREWLTPEVLEAQMTYWKRQLGGNLPVLELPTDRPRPAVQTHRGAIQDLRLSTELSERLKAMTRKEGISLFMLILAAFKTLLFRYSGQDDITIGTPIAGRGHVETEKLIGFFVNTLVLRTDLSGNPSFRALLQHVREVVLDAHKHQHIPFEKLVDELHVERTLSYSPLFQVWFFLENAGPEGLQLPGLRLSGLGGGNKTAKFDLTLGAVESAQHITFSLEYNTDLFDEATIRRMLSHFENLLQAIVSQPDRSLLDLPLLSDEESRHLISDFNPQAPSLPPAVCMHELFEAHAAQSPESPAISFDGFHLPYGKVNERANRVAHHLRSLGVGPEQRVAVMLDRTPDLVIAILGILKAGAAYLPLDPSYPQERLAFMLQDAGAQVVVTEQALVDRWLLDSQATLVCLDDQVIATAANTNLAEVGVKPENAAYVIYTSGSTGRPKGVVVTHENVWRLMEVTRDDFQFDSSDVWTLFHSVSFDFSVWELWGPLAFGGRLVVVPYWVSREPESFYELLKEEKVTVLNQTPSAFRQLMKVDEEVGGELALRAVVFGGEALEMSTLRGWFERHGDERPRLVNMYGITETTVHVTYRELSARDTEGGSVIGGALKDLEVYVLDQQMHAVPEGVTGEMYVGGGGVARGYLGRAELTAQRFVPHPYSERAGARLYRTGDLARRRADGELEYVGRIDDQVKIRGFRIELGEIANALREQEVVKECVVLVVTDDGGAREKRIVAFVVPVEGESEVSASELRSELKNRLPDYMIPATIVIMDEMPLTSNGKVDKRRLLEAEKGSRGADEKSYVAPRTPVEEIIAGIWQQVLKVERVGVHDNFFELGGDSVLSIQVAARANQANLVFTTKQLFLHQTIAELATVVVEKDAEEAIENPGRARQDGEPYTPSDFPLANLSQKKLDKLVSADMRVEDIYPLSPMQQGMLFSSALSPEAGAYVTQTICALPGGFDSTAFRQACQKVIERHSILRTSFAWEGLEQPLQIVHATVELPWDEHDWRELPAAEQQARLQAFLSEDQQLGFELTKAPLMRFALFHTGDDACQLVWTSHHILLDGWSSPLVLKEVFDFYAASRRGEDLEMKQPRPFRDYIAWLQEQDLAKAETFWRETLQGFHSPTRFITEEMSSAANGKEAAFVETRIAIPQASASALPGLARQHQLTLNTIIQGVWALVISHYSGDNDVVFGSTVSGRPAELSGVETMVGLFINTLPVRVRLQDDESLVTWLQRLQREQAEMRQFDHNPLVQLQGWSDVPRGQSLFESNIVFFNLPEEASTRDPKDAAPKSQALAVRDLNVQSKTPTDIPVTLKAIPGTNSLQLEMLYNNQRIDAAGVERILKSCQAVIERILAQPQSDLQSLKNMLQEMEITLRHTEKSKRKEFDLKRLKSLKPKTVSVSREQLIKTDFLEPGATLPLVVQPNNGDIDLTGWAKNNREFIETNLLKHGGILFRGFDIDGIDSFDAFTKAISPEQLEYMDQHTPRTRLAGKIYTSTEYPAEHVVPFHSENSKNHVWPLKIWFYCMKAAERGGETPIADNAKVFELLSPAIRDRFVEKKVMYVRNFGEGVGLPWQTVFQTTERAEVEAYCREAGMEFEWKDENRLRMRHVCQSVARHPVTKKMLWFNQAHLFHISSLEASARESLLSIFKEHELPSNAYYGDGSPIEDSVIEEIRAAFKQASVAFPWQSRDILMLDNMWIAHGRTPYSGSRKVVVAMAESFSNAQL
ncbi:MAG TPA: amino acid adenylation domain-containing protein [Pyrinomonadaceae bacterium]